MSNNTNPLVSIIVPIYNVEKFLPQCIESLLQQTYANIEIILVNDGSSDKCGIICDTYENKDTRIKTIHKANGGLVSARNAGYEVAIGDWIMYVDGDDWINKNTCLTLVEEINNHSSLDIIFWITVQELGSKSIYEGKWDWDLFDDHKVYSGKECQWLACQVLNYKSGIASVCNKLYRREWCSNHKLLHNPGLKQGMEGIDYVFRAFSQAENCLFLRKHFYHYRYNSASISKKIDENNTSYIIDSLFEINKYINSLPDKNYYQEIFYERAIIALIAVAMGTYFHPDNQMPLREKATRFKTIISKNDFLNDAIRTVRYSNIGSERYLALWCLKHRYFSPLSLIAFLRKTAIKLGFYKF